MDKYQFTKAIESYYGRNLEGHIAVLYSGAVAVLSDPQRKRLFERLVETAKWFPKVVDIRDVMRELKFNPSSIQADRPRHEWTPTDCRFCKGEGRVSVYDNGTILPYSSFEGVQYRSEHRADYAYEQVARCCCPAGDGPGLCQAIGRIHWRQQEAS